MRSLPRAPPNSNALARQGPKDQLVASNGGDVEAPRSPAARGVPVMVAGEEVGRFYGRSCMCGKVLGLHHNTEKGEEGARCNGSLKGAIQRQSSDGAMALW
jgi:hypothetical protein